MNNEIVELTNMCMITKGEDVLIQHRKKNNWDGVVFPGGHIEKNESIILSVIREIKEETGLNIKKPILCGVKQFFTEKNIRYIVFLFKTSMFDGKLKSSEEGDVEWVKIKELKKLQLAYNFEHLLHVFNNNEIQELFYEKNGNHIFY